ncbi:hypothetical protein Tco_1556125 [Tanacetum coccineum]
MYHDAIISSLDEFELILGDHALLLSLGPSMNNVVVVYQSTREARLYTWDGPFQGDSFKPTDLILPHCHCLWGLTLGGETVLTSILDRPKIVSLDVDQTLHLWRKSLESHISSNGRYSVGAIKIGASYVIFQCLESSNAVIGKDEWSILLQGDGSLVGIFLRNPE